MELSESEIYEAKGIIIVFLVQSLCIVYMLNSDAAYNKLLRTKTYQLLLDTVPNLYMESREYVHDKLLAELRGDWDRWLII